MVTYKIRHNPEFEDYDVYRERVRQGTFNSIEHALESVKSDVSKYDSDYYYTVVIEL